MDTLDEIEKQYYSVEWPKVLNSIAGMRDEVPENEKKEMRLAYLNDELAMARRKLFVVTSEYMASEKELKYWPLLQIENLTKKTRTLASQIKAITESKKTGVSQTEIELAKNYSLALLIENRQGMALCPFHSERRPSLNIKNNFYYCHGCGEHGDVIDFVMKRENLTFEQAVRRLI